jgi:hypothetical protein
MNDIVETPPALSKPARKRRAPAAAAALAADKSPETPPEPAAPRLTTEELLQRLEACAADCEKVQRVLGAHQVPEVDAIIKLHRTLLLKFSLEAQVSPEMLKMVDSLMKPVMDWARLEEKRRELELAERKYRDELESRKQEQARETSKETGLAPETLEKIELELKLL